MLRSAALPAPHARRPSCLLTRPRPSNEPSRIRILYVAGERSWYFRADADSARSRGVVPLRRSWRAEPSTRSWTPRRGRRPQERLATADSIHVCPRAPMLRAIYSTRSAPPGGPRRNDGPQHHPHEDVHFRGASWSALDLSGFPVEATDGDIGTVDDVTYELARTVRRQYRPVDLRQEGHAPRRPHQPH